MTRVMPEITQENEAFWTGGARGELMITRCDDCGHSIHPPEVICPLCLSLSVHARPATGTGTVIARTINRQQWAPEMKVPFALAIVELDGEPGVRITAPVVECDPEAVAIGDRLQVVFEQTGDLWFPKFRPIA